MNLAVARHTVDALEAAGRRAVLTRTADYRVTLATRAEIARKLAPRAFVSIHHNAEPDGPFPRPGTETYYQVRGSTAASSKRLAGLVYEEVVAALGRVGPGVQWVADRDAGAKFRRNGRGDDYYGIVRMTQGVPGVLAELAFISNREEARLLARPDVQRAEGGAVARGVLRFLAGERPDPSVFTTPYPRSTPAGPGGGAAGCVDPPLG